jgi:hypothetical protein
MRQNLKTYLVTITEGDCEPQSFFVRAFSHEHAEELAWNRCGGESGNLSQSTQITTTLMS